MLKIIKPLFIWAGGKSKMFKHYKDLMPPVEDIHSYSEPFLGGGAMFLYVIKKYDIKTAYLNDINHDIIGVYQSIKDHPQDFCAIVDDYQCRFIPLPKPNPEKKKSSPDHWTKSNNRKSFFYEVREEYIENYDDWSYLKRSAVLYFLMKTGFNGIWQSSKKANGKFYTPSGLLNQKDVIYDKVNVLMWNEILNDYNVTLTSDDWKNVPVSDFTFYDPPYRDSFTNYSTIFPDSEHKLLIERVESNKNVWLCNRDAGDGFFDGCDAILKKFPVTYTAGRRKKTDDGYKAKKATEILLYNSEEK